MGEQGPAGSNRCCQGPARTSKSRDKAWWDSKLGTATNPDKFDIRAVLGKLIRRENYLAGSGNASFRL